ncbi:MAG: hypothetical protein SFV32_03460 [Opitutaceae bacterium]|nr:hypothetical protein [Opitutaceae bacterium]
MQTIKREAVPRIPQILYWKWDERIFQPGLLEAKLTDIFARSNFDCLYVSFHWLPRPFQDPELQAVIRRCALWLNARGKHFFLDIDVRNEGATILAEHPSAHGWFLEYREFDLDAEGNGELALSPQTTLRWGKKKTETARSLVAAWSFVARGADAYEPGSARRLFSEARLENPGEANARVVVRWGSELARRRVAVFLGHTHVSPDFFSPVFTQHFERMFELVKDLPLSGVGTDEWGYSLTSRWDQQMLAELVPYSPLMSERYAEYAGNALEDDLLHLFRSPADRPGVRFGAINRWIRVFRNQMAATEGWIYNKAKATFGRDTFIAAHPTWVCARHEMLIETLYNGFAWWQIRRDFGQTDESSIIPVRLALGHRAGGPVWYNMWYSMGPGKNIESFFRETWRNARWGGRTHQLGYECPNEDITEFVDAGKLEQIWAMESRIQRLNTFQKTAPDSRVLILFGMEAVTNWSTSGEPALPVGERHQVMRETFQLAEDIFDAGWLCDVVPTTALSLSEVTFAWPSFASYGSQVYDVVIVVNPEGMESSAMDAMVLLTEENVKTMLVGKGRYDFDGNIATEAHQAFAAAFPVRFERPDLGGITAKLREWRIPGNRYANGCRLQDGSAVFAADGDLPTGNPLTVEAKIGSHQVRFEGEDFLAIELSPEGKVKRCAFGAAKALEVNGKSVPLDSLPT